MNNHTLNTGLLKPFALLNRGKWAGIICMLTTFIFFSFGACNVVILSNTENDGSGNIAPDRLAADTVGANSFITYVNTNGEKLKKRFDKSDINWVYLWAPWCPHCYLDLTKHIRFDSLRQFEELDIHLVSTNYDTTAMTKYLKKSEFSGTVNILSAEDYGINEEEKIKTFSHDLSVPSSEISPGIPQHFVFYRDSLILCGSNIQQVDSVLALKLNEGK